MQEDLARLEEIFGQALAKADAEERAEYLAQACGDDALLRARMEALLAAHEAADHLLKLPDADMTADASRPISEGPGTTIGRYKLLEQIGEGGFGVVFMSEQLEPVRRKVALKIIKLGMDTKQVVARFEAERQALAMMDHPSIAQVLDGGATETGRPYFVMELIRGRPITEYCDAESLSIPQRLDLFRQVCHAIQHAHQKGIIHRDLKPTNVLVTLLDDRPVPKIIDFGVAKATQSKLTEQTFFTGFHQLIGTPAYMSPEQAQLSGMDVDTRSDIYSLGVLLYELLTGTTPFDSKELAEVSFAEMQRIIREVDPPTPSTRLSTLDADSQTTKAGLRNSDPKRLRHLLQGDLDWIVMKCLEKDRNRRYESASSLARDVEYFLADEPVLACPPSAAYRMRKFVRRNRLAFLAAAALATALVAGLASTTWMYLKEKDARRRAEAAEVRASSAAETSAEVTALLKDMLAGGGSSTNSPNATAMHMMLLRQILANTVEHPDAARSLNNLGGILHNRGQYAEAEMVQRRALAIRRKILGDADPDVANSLNNLALELRDQGKLAEAEEVASEGLTLARRLPGTDAKEQLNRAYLLNNLATVLQLEGQFKEAEGLLHEALAIRKQLLGDKHVDTAESLHFLAGVVRDQGRLPEADKHYREALQILRANPTADVAYLAYTLTEFVPALLAEGNYVEAESLARENFEIRDKNRPDAWDTFSARSLLGAVLLAEKKYDDAEPLLVAGYDGMKLRNDKIPAYGKRRVKEAVERLVQVYEAIGQADQVAQWRDKLAELNEASAETKQTSARP